MKVGGGEGCFFLIVVVLVRIEKGLYEGGRGGKEEGELGKRLDGMGILLFLVILGLYDVGC